MHSEDVLLDDVVDMQRWKEWGIIKEVWIWRWSNIMGLKDSSVSLSFFNYCLSSFINYTIAALYVSSGRRCCFNASSWDEWVNSPVDAGGSECGNTELWRVYVRKCFMSQVGRHQSQQEGNTTRHPTTLDKIHGFSWTGCGMIIQKQIITKEVSISSVCVFTNPVNKDTEFALTKYERTATVSQSPRQSQQPLNPIPVYSDLMWGSHQATEHDLRWQ